MTRKASLGILLAIVALLFLSGLWMYPSLPDRMDSHWDLSGKADSTLPRFWGVFLLPFTGLFLLALYGAILRFDPLKSNIEKFRKIYDGFFIALLLFFLYLHILVLLWNRGLRFHMIQCLVPAMACLFWACGTVIRYARPNWSVGIRTPWTLSSETVWTKIHEKGGRLFKVCGVIALLGVLLPNWALAFVLGPLLGVSLYLIVDSYVLYKREKET